MEGTATPTPTPTPTEPVEPKEGESLLTPPTEGEPPKEAEPAEPPAPLTADDIKFDEDLEVPEELRDELLGVFNNAELDAKGRAQALVDLHTKAMKEASEASSQAWANMQKEWRDAVKADPLVGGEKMQPALDRIGRLVNEYADAPDELIGAFGVTGAGNNPHVVRFLAKIADKLVEGEHVSGAPATSPQDAASKLFPSMKG